MTSRGCSDVLVAPEAAVVTRRAHGRTNILAVDVATGMSRTILRPGWPSLDAVDWLDEALLLASGSPEYGRQT